MKAGDPKQSTVRISAAAAVFAAISLALSPASAAYITVYGGPAYDAATQTGYLVPGFFTSSRTAGNGVGVGSATKYTGGTDLGWRAFRWDASGAAATELGHLGTNSSGYTESFAFSINTAGTAVGSARKGSGDTYGNIHAVRWDASGTAATELGHLGTNEFGVTNSKAFAINSAGTAVGYASKVGPGGTYLGDRAVRWDASGTAATELGHIGTDSSGYTAVEAQAVNTGGTAVGFAVKYNGNTELGPRAVRWDASGTAATELGNLGTSSSGRTVSYALDVNTAGIAIGYAEKYSPAGMHLGTRAVRWDPSGTAATELGNLGTGSGYTESQAYAMNSAGTAVGYAFKYSPDGPFLNYTRAAVRWDALGAATELGNDINNGISGGEAYAVNTAGVAVGYGYKFAGDTFVGYRAMLWGLDAVAIDLNKLIDPTSGWTLTTANGISDSNWVTGLGSFDPDGAGPLAVYDRAFLLDVSSLVDALPGDYNGDGTVDAADYVVWRKTIGTPTAYNTWRDNFGATRGSVASEAATTSVPEPAAGALALLGVSSILLLRRRSMGRSNKVSLSKDEPCN